jgi:hypothetical protein
VLLVFGVIDIAVDCGVAVNARGVIVGVAFPFEDVRPLQADRNTSSKLIPAHVTYVPVRLLLYLLSSWRNRKERMHVSGMLTIAEINTNVNATFILRFSLSFQSVIIEKGRCF